MTPRIGISAWAIKNPVPVVVLMLALIIAGLIAYPRLPIKKYPSIEFPAVSVTVNENGATAAELETQVTRPIENALAGLTNVEAVVSTIAQGTSTTVVQFQLGENLEVASDQVRARVDLVRAELPAEIDPPVVARVDIDDAPILSYAVESDTLSVSEVSWLIDDALTRTIQRQSGVGQVSRVGGVERAINVTVDPARLAAVGLTLPQLNDTLRRTIVNDPGGRTAIGGREQSLRVLNMQTSGAALRNMLVPIAGGRFVTLADVAEIGDGETETRTFARLDGAPAVGFQVSKTRDASELAVEDEVDASLKSFVAAHPAIHIRKIYSTVDETRGSYQATLRALLEGMLLSALAVWIFLRDPRATLIAAIAMPASLIPTFACMAILGYSLNTVTLLALALVTGIIVDDAIVEIENIERRRQSGLTPYETSLAGADAIGLAVVATTATIVAVFTPVSFMAGIPGQFFREFGLTVSIAVIFSLLVARFLTPLMAAHLLGKTSHAPSTPRLADRYRGLLDLTLRRPLIAVGICLAVLATTAFIVPLLPLGFQPAGNPDYIYAKIQGPPGATASDMDSLVHQSTTLFAAQPETLHVFAQVGSKIISTSGGDRGAADLRDATMTIVLNPGRQTSVSAFKQRLRPALRSIPDGDIHFLSEAGGADVVTVLTGDDPQQLEATSAELLKEIASVRQIADPRYASPPRAPEIRIEPRIDAAGRLGVSTDTIAAISRMGTIGDSDANVAKINDGDRRIPVQLRYQDDVKQDLVSLSALPIPTATGGQTTLGSVADISFGAGPAKINHFDRRRQITIEADLQEGAELGDATRAIRQLPIMQSFPDGIRQSTVGNQRAMDQLFDSFALVFAAALTAVYCVLVLLFRSFIRPIVIVCALPPALSGAFIFLYATGCSLNLPSLIGILMVLGLSAKNSILLVDYAAEREREGYKPGDAIVEACMMRARPILMTTLAMIGGMIPAALALGKGAEFRQPMAMAVIGGLLTTTLVSLLLVPAAHLLISRIGTRSPSGLAHAPAERPDRA